MWCTMPSGRMLHDQSSTQHNIGRFGGWQFYLQRNRNNLKCVRGKVRSQMAGAAFFALRFYPRFFMMTSSNGNIFALLAICAGNSPVHGEFPAQTPVTRSFDIFFDLRLNKRLSKHSRGWRFETLSCPLWRHRNVCLSTGQLGVGR